MNFFPWRGKNNKGWKSWDRAAVAAADPEGDTSCSSSSCCGSGFGCMAPAGLCRGAFAGLILPVRKSHETLLTSSSWEKINESSTGQSPGCLGSAVAGGQAGQPPSARPSKPLSHEISLPTKVSERVSEIGGCFCWASILEKISQPSTSDLGCFVSTGFEPETFCFGGRPRTLGSSL